MKILLKDPAKMDAVIEKITHKYPCSQEMFLKYGMVALKERASESDPVLLDVNWINNPDNAQIESEFNFIQFSDIPTDTEFLNDKE